MRRSTLGALLLLGAAACSHSPTAPPAPLGVPFRLGVGHSVTVAGAGVEVGLDQVSDDSRCPGDAICVWPGTAHLKAWLRVGGERRELELQTFPRLPLLVEGLSIDVQALEPFPYSNVRIDPRGYVATLIVTRP